MFSMIHGKSEDRHEHNLGRKRGIINKFASQYAMRICVQLLVLIFLSNLPFVGLKFLAVYVFMSVFRLAM